MLQKELEQQHGITINKLDPGILSREQDDKYYSPYSEKSQFIVIVQNPTDQVHQELLELEMPYAGFEVRRLKADGTSPLVSYDQFKPTVFFNSAK